MKMIIATNNAHKVIEFKRILEPLGYQVISLKEAGISIEVEETGETFAENATLKANAVYHLARMPVIADDSGLCVEALDGAPGVYSARYGGEGLDDQGRNLLLLKNMEGITNRKAKFVCAIVLVQENGEVQAFLGESPGEIGFEERGEYRFGYDPVFVVNGQTFAEMPPEEKDRLSHRGRASELLLEYLNNK